MRFTIYRALCRKNKLSTPLFAGVAIPSGVFWVQFRHPPAGRALFECVLPADVHHHLDVVGFIDVQLFPHRPEQLVFTRRDDSVLEHHLHHVSIILNRGEVAMVENHTTFFCDEDEA